MEQERYNNRRGYNNYYNDYNRGYNNRRNNYYRHNNQNRPKQQPKKPPADIPATPELFQQWKSTQAKKHPADSRKKTEDVTQTKGNDFEDWGLSRPLLMGIFEMGFEKPSPIQEQAIPTILMGNSVLARAKNGTGKTGAFAIPCLQRVDANKPHTQLLVLLPTRELALQTSNVFIELAKFLNLEIVVSTGGTNLKEDIIRLQKNVHIVIGTPGRLQDLNTCGRLADMDKDVLKLNKCGLIVLDEADKLLSPDFLPAVENLLEATPDNRQLMLFSATFATSISDFKQKWLPEAAVINQMKDSLTLRGISQFYAFVDESQKVHCLYALMKKLEINQCIIFCNSVNRVELLSRKISRLGFANCYYIHGQMNQKYRNQVFHNFREGKSRYMVCTDIFTRGIDVKSLNVVINFDFPRSSNTYLHRIGRSGRFGHLGLAVNFITNDDRQNMCKIETELNTEVLPIPAQIDSTLYK